MFLGGPIASIALLAMLVVRPLGLGNAALQVEAAVGAARAVEEIVNVALVGSVRTVCYCWSWPWCRR